MNLSHVRSDVAPQPKSYVGIALVAALHVAGIYALSAGLIQPPARVKEPAVLLPPIPEPREPEILRQPAFKPDKPVFGPVQVPEVPVPPSWQETPTITAVPMSEVAPAPNQGTTTGPSTPPTTPPAVDAHPVVRAAGAVCSTMPRPEVPTVNWSGEAVLQVVATVRGGRVVSSEFRVTQGALDGKTRRSLQRSVESALAGYQCEGDAMFQQDFAFRLD